MEFPLGFCDCSGSMKAMTDLCLCVRKREVLKLHAIKPPGQIPTEHFLRHLGKEKKKTKKKPPLLQSIPTSISITKVTTRFICLRVSHPIRYIIHNIMPHLGNKEGKSNKPQKETPAKLPQRWIFRETIPHPGSLLPSLSKEKRRKGLNE